jgi:hypothetical protein
MLVGGWLSFSVLRKRYKFMKEVHMETGKYPYGYYQMMGFLYSMPFFLLLWFLFYKHKEAFGYWSDFLFPLAVFLPVIIFSQLWARINAKNVRNITRFQKINEFVVNVLTGLVTLFILYMLLTHSFK